MSDESNEIVAWLKSADVIVTLGSLVIILLGVLFIAKSLIIVRAKRRDDEYMLAEFESKKHPPFFHLVLGVALVLCGIIVFFSPTNA